MHTITHTIEMNLPGIIAQHLDAHRTFGQDWPVDATHAVTYRMKTWPCGWDEGHARFFTNESELRQWHADMIGWSRMEDNYFEITGTWVWDWGPTPFSL